MKIIIKPWNFFFKDRKVNNFFINKYFQITIVYDDI